MIISVFGASNPSDDLYDLAYKLGRYLGEKGHTVKNGGYGGTMEASAKGCQKVRGHTIGVCVEGHKIDKMGHPNNYLNDVKIMPDVQHRITELLNADRIVVVKGNIGTLEEMFFAWVNAIEYDKKPIILLGKEMKDLVEYLLKNNFLKDEHKQYIEVYREISEIQL